MILRDPRAAQAFPDGWWSRLAQFNAARVAPFIDPRRTVYHRLTGEAFTRYRVDAAEMLASGEYTATRPAAAAA